MINFSEGGEGDRDGHLVTTSDFVCVGNFILVGDLAGEVAGSGDCISRDSHRIGLITLKHDNKIHVS